MSSSPLYLAIVVVWILVLVPMLLRRDAADPAAGGLRRGPAADDESDAVPDDEYEPVEYDAGTGDEEPDRTAGSRRDRTGETGDDGGSVEHEAASAPYFFEEPVRVSRARVIARRRRRTSGLVLLLAATGAAVGMGLGPWWVLVPPALLLLGHLVLLREAAKADAEQRAAEREHRRREEAARARRAEEEAAREAEIIELANRRNQVYDQYADAQLRAAGD
ncbi:divisome protein SepX/GlpR [Actinorugispora endophytica]|uniref:Uncharacterized protein n=1 Tax=Actinorugispora endophytica TaxID=1605990 RepID=A0A4R6UC69_9ACTN|nr:hypothetical protein [Actinorugispora endophytica]TDQ44268.1 hypothetical protein EV190_13625 [Actinorugispora endophytica]